MSVNDYTFIGALIAAVGALYKWQLSNCKKTEDRAERLEKENREDRDKYIDSIAEMKTEFTNAINENTQVLKEVGENVKDIKEVKKDVEDIKERLGVLQC